MCIVCVLVVYCVCICEHGSERVYNYIALPITYVCGGFARFFMRV